MNKNTADSVSEIILSRRSPVAYSDRSVEPEKINTLFEAARWAPSSYNEQPWRFAYAVKEDPDEFRLFLDTLMEGNRVWAKNAPMLVLSLARMEFARNNRPNRHAFHDVGMAVGNLLIQATAMGLVVHQMGGFSLEKAKHNLSVQDGYEPVAMMTIGYQGKMDDLPEDLKSRELQPRIRKPLDELVYKGRMR
jgi:nitroreductase